MKWKREKKPEVGTVAEEDGGGRRMEGREREGQEDR